jgi:hypothetical protein
VTPRSLIIFWAVLFAVFEFGFYLARKLGAPRTLIDALAVIVGVAFVCGLLAVLLRDRGLIGRTAAARKFLMGHPVVRSSLGESIKHSGLRETDDARIRCDLTGGGTSAEAEVDVSRESGRWRGTGGVLRIAGVNQELGPGA